MRNLNQRVHVLSNYTNYTSDFTCKNFHDLEKSCLNDVTFSTVVLGDHRLFGNLICTLRNGLQDHHIHMGEMNMETELNIVDKDNMNPTSITAILITENSYLELSITNSYNVMCLVLCYLCYLFMVVYLNTSGKKETGQKTNGICVKYVTVATAVVVVFASFVYLFCFLFHVCCNIIIIVIIILVIIVTFCARITRLIKL